MAKKDVKEVSAAPGFAAAPGSTGAPAPSAAATPKPAFASPAGGAAPPRFAQAPGNQPVSAAGSVRAVTGPVSASEFGMQQYLKGSDVPKEEAQVRCKVKGFVQIPGSRSPLVAEIEPVYGKQYLPLNKTNIAQIAGITQIDDLSVIIGYVLVLTVYPVNNPSSGAMTRGLYVSGIETAPAE
jgi:hypothetical protein